MDMQAFYTGHAFDAYEFFGAHSYFGGTHFAVWAPAALTFVSCVLVMAHLLSFAAASAPFVGLAAFSIPK